MKLLFFLVRREIRFRWRALLPFTLIASALFFAFVSLVTFQESAQTVAPVPYMTSPTYTILFAAFSLIGFTAARTSFVLYSENLLPETGALRALGVKKRMIRRIRFLLGSACMLASALLSLPLSLLFVYGFVSVCTTVDMTATSYVPLAWRIPVGNILIVLAILSTAMLLGVMSGYAKETSIAAMIRRSAVSADAENGSGFLPEDGTLSDYGKLFVRRSVRRCLRHNIIISALLILPMIFVLGASTFTGDNRTHTFYLRASYDIETHTFVPITENMLAGLERLPGVEHAAAGIWSETHREFGPTCIWIYTKKEADTALLRTQIRDFSDRHSLQFEDSAALRRPQNLVARSYRIFFLTISASLMAAALLTTTSLLKARLHTRRQELTILHRLGARIEDLRRAVTPETIADFAAGAFLSILLGALGFTGMMRDGGGQIEIIPLILLCLVCLAANLYVEVRLSGRMLQKMMTESEAVRKQKGDCHAAGMQ